MFSFKSLLLLATFTIIAVSATPIEYENVFELLEPEDSLYYEWQPGFRREVRSLQESEDLNDIQPDVLYLESEPILSRQARSPQHGNINLGVSKDQFGRQASIDYNHNLYKSSNGRGSIDAYAQASRNFDHNRNDFGGGVRGSWRF